MARHHGVRRCCIYALLDLRTGETRYIGQTVDLEARLDSHLRGAKAPKSHCHQWIAQLLAEGLMPIMVTLEEGDWTAKQLNDAERRWIKRYDNLTNMTPGGEGGGVKGMLYGSHDRSINSGFCQPDVLDRALLLARKAREARSPEQKRLSALKALETRRTA